MSITQSCQNPLAYSLLQLACMVASVTITELAYLTNQAKLADSRHPDAAVVTAYNRLHLTCIIWGAPLSQLAHRVLHGIIILYGGHNTRNELQKQD
jgi:hypothetical protein